MSDQEVRVEQRNYWVWSTHPTKQHIEALDGGQGYWTCHADTREGDLALVYLSAPDSHIGYLVEATSNATPHRGDPKNPGEWDGSPSCDFEKVARFAHPLTLGEMKADPFLAADFSGLRAYFRMRAYAVPAEVWDHVADLLVAANPSTKQSMRRAGVFGN